MRKILFICMMMCMFSSMVFAAEGRWIQIEGKDGCYVDSKTAIYDSSTNSIYFWIKFEYKSALENMEYHHVNINEARSCCVKNAFYGGKTDPKVTTYADKPHLEIMPDDIIEKASDVVCDIYGVPHMYPNDVERWKYLYSTDECTTYYAHKIVNVDRKKSIVVLYTKSISEDSKYASTIKWICNIRDNSVESITILGKKKKYVLPDTLEEAIFDVARTYIDRTK